MMYRPSNALVVVLALAGTLCSAGWVLADGPDKEHRTSQGQAQNCPVCKIQAALGMRVRLRFEDTPLADIAGWIEEQCKIPVKLDVKALRAVRIRGDRPVSTQDRDITLRAALRLILDDLGLTYLVRNEMLLITTPEEAEAWPAVRVYEVSDLVGGDGGGGKTDQQPPADFDSLIDLITSVINPESWDEVGGPGMIDTFDRGDRKVLVISQTDQTHEQIGRLLDMLRRVEPGAILDSRCICGQNGSSQQARPDRRGSSAPQKQRPARRR